MKIKREEWLLTAWFWFVVILGVGGCHIAPAPVTPVEPDPEQSAFDCASACARLRELGCPEAENTAGGATCEQVCDNVQSSGIVSWDLACRSRAPSCPAVDLCER
jgi:hypothetical protein